VLVDLGNDFWVNPTQVRSLAISLPEDARLGFQTSILYVGIKCSEAYGRSSLTVSEVAAKLNAAGTDFEKVVDDLVADREVVSDALKKILEQTKQYQQLLTDQIVLLRAELAGKSAL